jgi:hypothetical protein
MKVKPPRPPSAQSVQTKKKPPADLAPEQYLHDITIERERQQSQQGHATPAVSR